MLFRYYDNDNDNKEIIIIFHGFSSKKEACLPLASGLSNQYRIIIPDLMGHGNTINLKKNHKECNYDIKTQLKYLQKFIINILGTGKKIHIIGYSMGALLAGCFAAEYPNMIKSVNLLCPAGISMPSYSPVYQHYIKTGDNLLSTRTIEEAKELLYLLQCKYKFFPDCAFEYYSNEYNKKGDIYDKIFNEIIISNYPILEKKLKHIQSDVLVIHGNDDKIIDKSCITNIIENLNVKYNTYIIENAGHVIHNTHFQECAELIDIHIQNNS